MTICVYTGKHAINEVYEAQHSEGILCMDDSEMRGKMMGATDYQFKRMQVGDWNWNEELGDHSRKKHCADLFYTNGFFKN